MKLRIWSVLVAFIIVFIACSNGEEVRSDEVQMQFMGPGFEWLLKKVPKPYSVEELADIFKARNRMLSTHYNNDEFEKIGKYYGEAGMVRTYYDNYVYGSCDIADYFKELKTKRNVNAVKFETNLVYLDVDTHLAENPSPDYPDKDLVYTVYEIISISYDIEGKSPDRDTSSASGPHSRPTFRNGGQ